MKIKRACNSIFHKIKHPLKYLGHNCNCSDQCTKTDAEIEEKFKKNDDYQKFKSDFMKNTMEISKNDVIVLINALSNFKFNEEVLDWLIIVDKVS